MFKARQTKRAHNFKKNDGGASDSSSSPLDFYANIPTFELSLDEFEEYALARLRVLRKIEDLKTRNVTGDKFHTSLDSTVRSNLSDTTSSSHQTDTPKNRRIDQASHFILRAAYCRTEELRRWFLTQETTLFRHRLEKISRVTSSLNNFLSRGNIEFDKVSDAEKEQKMDKLMACPNVSDGSVGSNVFSLGEFTNTTFFKIPFGEALDLVRARLVFVERGFAYVPMSRLVSIITARFRTNLSKSLVHASAAFPHVAESTRIGPLLQSMNQQYTGKDYTTANLDSNELNSSNIDQLAPRSMPLCAQQMHSGLKQHSKLKHSARFQYGLFLKGAGMTMEEQLIYFQGEFTRIMSSEQFQKSYSYNIRHLYGKEGKRSDYTPLSCTKIILGSPPVGEDQHHGCPFRHYDNDNLSSLLGKLGINGQPKESIMVHKKMNNYQLACAKHFEVMHPNAMGMEGLNLEGVGNHPNAWFKSSMRYYDAIGGDADKEKEVNVRDTEPVE